MRTNSPAERIALNPKRQNKPVLFWEAVQCGAVIDTNNSIALLRFKWKGVQGVTFKAKR